MAAEELDLTIIEATAEYRPGHQNGTRTVESHVVETPPGDELRTPPAGGVEPSLLESRIAQLEADIESWRRRSITWRERALSIQALNEALNTNLDDLRLVVRAMAAGATPTSEVEVGDVPASQRPASEYPASELPARQHPAPQPVSATVVDWCNKVFRRDFWTGPR